MPLTRLAAPWPLAAMVALHSATALDNGVGLLPFMGWSTWNPYGLHVNQSRIEKAIDAIATKRNGGLSLADLGYTYVNLDDGWQDCGKGVLRSFHDQHGNPLVDKHKFPDLKALTSLAHRNGLKAGWYSA